MTGSVPHFDSDVCYPLPKRHLEYEQNTASSDHCSTNTLSYLISPSLQTTSKLNVFTF